MVNRLKEQKQENMRYEVNDLSLDILIRMVTFVAKIYNIYT